MREQISVSTLVLLRIYAGVAMARAAITKLAGAWLTEPKLADVLAKWLHEGKPYGFYAPFLREVALPHAHLFSYLVVGGELLVGAALILGLFTRPAAVGGILLTLNFLLGQGDGLTATSTTAFVMIFVTILLTNPGRALGLDAALQGRVPRWLS